MLCTLIRQQFFKWLWFAESGEPRGAPGQLQAGAADAAGHRHQLPGADPPLHGGDAAGQGVRRAAGARGHRAGPARHQQSQVNSSTCQ